MTFGHVVKQAFDLSEKRIKVHRLLYHSLSTNVVEGERNIEFLKLALPLLFSASHSLIR